MKMKFTTRMKMTLRLNVSVHIVFWTFRFDCYASTASVIKDFHKNSQSYIQSCNSINLLSEGTNSIMYFIV